MIRDLPCLYESFSWAWRGVFFALPFQAVSDLRIGDRAIIRRAGTAWYLSIQDIQVSKVEGPVERVITLCNAFNANEAYFFHQLRKRI